MTQTTLTQPLPSGRYQRDSTWGGRASRLGRDSAYVLLGFPAALASFVVLVTGVSLAAGLLVTLLGIPVAVLTLALARLFAGVERASLRALGVAVPPPVYREVTAPGWRRWLDALRDPQSWLDLVHGIVRFPVALAAWCVAVTWWAGALAGTTYVFWSWALPSGPDNQRLSEMLGYSGRTADVLLETGIGLAFLFTLLPVLRGCAAVQSGLSKALLANESVGTLQRRVQTLARSRDAAVEAEAQALRRLERDIHDGPQQRLVRLTMDLGTVARRLEDDPDAARPIVEDALTQTREALAELRALSRGIAPPVLADRGLAAALTAVAARCTVRVDLDVALPDGQRLPASVENAAYFVVTEALTNVAKHSGATRCHVSVSRDGGVLWVVVEDDGRGGAHPAKGHGLSGLADRLAALEGTLDVVSPAGGPTRLTAEVPCG